MRIKIGPFYEAKTRYFVLNFRISSKADSTFPRSRKTLFYKYGIHTELCTLLFSHGFNTGLAVDFYYIAKVFAEIQYVRILEGLEIQIKALNFIPQNSNNCQYDSPGKISVMDIWL